MAWIDVVVFFALGVAAEAAGADMVGVILAALTYFMGYAAVVLTLICILLWIFDFFFRDDL